MRWVLAQNVGLTDQLAIMSDEQGYIILFNSKAEIDDFIETAGVDPEIIIAMPEMETI